MVEANLQYNFSTKSSNFLTRILLINPFLIVILHVLFSDFSKQLLQASAYTTMYSPRLAAGG